MTFGTDAATTHGPVTDVNGLRSMEEYLRHVVSEGAKLKDKGLTPFEAANEIDLSRARDLAPARFEVRYHHADVSLAFLQPRRSETPVSGAAVISTARMRANMAPRLFTRALGGSNPLTLTISTSRCCRTRTRCWAP